MLFALVRGKRNQISMADTLPANIRELCMGPDEPVRGALHILEASHREIVLVVSGAGQLLGTVTDGDVRRGLLAGQSLDTPLALIMSRQPIVGVDGLSRREHIEKMKQHRILQLPVVDTAGRIIDLVLFNETMPIDIPLSDTALNEREIEAVSCVLRSGWLSMGETTEKFERKFAEFTGATHAIAVSNGTAALHLACAALELGPDDEVLCPSLSFVATANAIRYTGAKPVFCDIRGEDDLTVNPDELAARITPRTKAVVVMHYGGYACAMPEITALANEYGLYLIEDAAHAPGARAAGRACGTWGDVGCFSFFANKNMTTGEGGMVTTHSDAIAAKVRLMRSHGMTSLTLERHRGRAFSYDVVELGYNYRLDEMRAALGLVQLEQLADWNKQRRVLVRRYRALLQEASGSGWTVPFAELAVEDASCHIMPILLDPGVDRAKVMRRMRADGVQTSIHYPAIHTFSYYRDEYAVQLPWTEAAAARQLTLPLYPSMTNREVERVVDVLAGATACTSQDASLFVGN